MSDLIAGPGTGGAGGPGNGLRNDGAPPPVLMAALAAAVLIGVVLFAALGRFGGEGEAPAPVAADVGAAAAQRERVALTVTLMGGGDGAVQIQPGDIACTRSCKHEFDRGTRVTVSADAGAGSRFASWSDACSGSEECTIVMNGPRSVDATFASEPAEPSCDELDGADPACADDLDALDPGGEVLDPGAEEPERAPAPDCSDGRDNDRDGLTDLAQDPDCTGGGSESGSATAPATSTSPSGATVTRSECDDGRDNDRDGLTDTEQDPNCLEGSTESG